MIFAKVFLNLQIFSLLSVFSKSDASTKASQKGSLIPRSLLKVSLKVADLKGKYNFEAKKGGSMLFYEQQDLLDIHIIPIHIVTVIFVRIC